MGLVGGDIQGRNVCVCVFFSSPESFVCVVFSRGVRQVLCLLLLFRPSGVMPIEVFCVVFFVCAPGAACMLLFRPSGVMPIRLNK